MNHLDDFTLNEYLDHALDESVRAEAEAHLQTCIACRAKLEEFRAFFAELDNLPEAPLERDLTPGILARLPHKVSSRTTWIRTRAFAAQLGVVIGFVFWLGMQIVPLIRTPQFALPELPTIEVRTLFMSLLSVQFPIPEFRFPVFNFLMPTFDVQLPSINMQLSTTHAVALALSTLLLWVVGNIVLLKSRQEVES